MNVIVTSHALDRFRERSGRAWASHNTVRDHLSRARQVPSDLVWSLLQRTRDLPTDERHYLCEDGELLFVLKDERSRKGVVLSSVLVTVLEVADSHRYTLRAASRAPEPGQPDPVSLATLLLQVATLPKPEKGSAFEPLVKMLRSMACAAGAMGLPRLLDQRCRELVSKGASRGVDPALIELARRLTSTSV